MRNFLNFIEFCFIVAAKLSELNMKIFFISPPEFFLFKLQALLTIILNNKSGNKRLLTIIAQNTNLMNPL